MIAYAIKFKINKVAVGYVYKMLCFNCEKPGYIYNPGSIGNASIFINYKEAFDTIFELTDLWAEEERSFTIVKVEISEVRE